MTQVIILLYNQQMIIIGLGNPKNKYKNSRHNVGEAILTHLVARPPSGFEVGEWNFDKKADAEAAVFAYEGKDGRLVLPQTFMNLSGKSVANFIYNPTEASDKLVVIYDDLALPVGTFKISFDRGSGGHNGIESITSVLKTKAFTRVRVGIAPVGFLGKIRKMFGTDKGASFVLGKFSPSEREELEKIEPKIIEAILTIIKEGREVAMNKYN